MPMHGPRLTSRDRTRIRLGNGVVRKRVSKGVFVEIDTDPAMLVVADGVAAWCQEVLAIAAANAPDDPTTPGSRIAESAQFGVYAFGQALTVEGSPRDFKKPRGFTPSPNGVDAVVTFRSRLHHLHELGTVHMDAHPYLGPAVAAQSADARRFIQQNWPQGKPRMGARGRAPA